MNTASSGHLAFANGKITDGTFECDSEQLSILQNAISHFFPLVNKKTPFTGEVSLIELLSLIEKDYDMTNPWLKEVSDCILAVHRKSITIH